MGHVDVAGPRAPRGVEATVLAPRGSRAEDHGSRQRDRHRGRRGAPGRRDKGQGRPTVSRAEAARSGGSSDRATIANRSLAEPAPVTSLLPPLAAWDRGSRGWSGSRGSCRKVGGVLGTLGGLALGLAI